MARRSFSRTKCSKSATSTGGCTWPESGYVLQTGRVALEGPAARLQNDEQVQEIYFHDLVSGIRRPREAGIQHRSRKPDWIPAYAGMSGAIRQRALRYRPRSHSASSRRLKALGFSAKRRWAMRDARCAKSVERSPQAGVSRERQRASG
jgi:hypothetical protein